MDTQKRQKGPLFIVGAPRSGTTMLQYMLRSHPRLSLPTGESHFIVPLQRHRDRFGDLSKLENVRAVLDRMYNQSKTFLETDLHGIRFDSNRLGLELCATGCDSIPKIIDGVFARNAAGEGKARWGDKTPYYVLHLPILLDMFPDAQIIHLIRDGRDVALSLFARQHDFHVYNTYFAARYWQHYVDIGHAVGSRLDPEVYLEVRYEDLLATPVVAVKRICQFLHEEFDQTVIDFNKAGEAGKTPLVQRPLQPSNAGKWRGRMSHRQIRIFEGAAGDTLARHGYPLVTTPRPPPLPVRALYRVHNYAATRCRGRFGATAEKK